MSSKRFAMLWRLDPPDGPSPSWLFGTMHAHDRRAFTLLERVKEKIRASEAFASEIHLGDAPALRASADLMLPPGQSLPGLLGAKKYHKLRRILQKAVGFDIHPFRRMKPMLLLNLVDQRMLSSDTAVSLDETLFRFAQGEGKTLLGIETYAEQLDLFRSIPLQVQLRALQQLGRNVRAHRRGLLRMTERYEKGDLATLYHGARRGAQQLRRPMIYRRNALMVRRIGTMARTRTTVFAIGAAHLWGGKGVLRGLKKKGFRMTPAMPDP